MSALLDQVEATIRVHRLLGDGEPVVLAVSGGVDSTVLLHVVARLAPRHRWRPVVAHFNHGLRGRASDGDEAWVAGEAARLGLVCVTGGGAVRAVARAEGLSVEMAARRLRHAFLAEVARRVRARVVWLGHHQGDQVELFFLRLLRGAGAEGMSGMDWSGASPADAGVTLGRPLLGCERGQLEAWATGEGLEWREDRSNGSLDILRNRLRRRWLPALRLMQPALDRLVVRAMEIVREEHACVVAVAREAVVGRGKFEGLPVAVQRLVLREAFLRQGQVPNFEVVEAIRTKRSTWVNVESGGRVRRDREGVLEWGEQRRARTSGESVVLDLGASAGKAVLGAAAVRWRRERVRGLRGLAARGGGVEEWFDADRVGRRVVLRHWRPGDRFQPSGMSGSVKVQDLFTNAKVPRHERCSRLVAATGGGILFWVEGLRIGERFKLKASTRERLIWCWGPTE